MRFKEFISESFTSDGISIEEAVQLLKDQGSDWKALTGGFPTNSTNWIIYRGMSVMYAPDFVVKYPRSKRAPLTTEASVHKAADAYLKKKFGIAFRSNSIFVARSKLTAKTYGDVYAIFPLGKVHFCWSEHVEDFTAEQITYKHKYEDLARAKKMTDEEIYEMMDSFEYHFDDDSLQEKYFKFRNFAKHELMIHCDEYLAVREAELNKFLDLLL